MFSKAYHHIQIYIGITKSISWASSTFVLFISPKQLVNGVQFLNITSLFLWFEAASCVEMFGNVIVILTSLYASL